MCSLQHHTDRSWDIPGPFELTKLSAQVSVLMANQKNVDPKKQAIALSYHNKGTIKTLKNIVRHRGFTGMYTGLNLHLRKEATSWDSLSSPPLPD